MKIHLSPLMGYILGSLFLLLDFFCCNRLHYAEGFSVFALFPFIIFFTFTSLAMLFRRSTIRGIFFTLILFPTTEVFGIVAEIFGIYRRILYIFLPFLPFIISDWKTRLLIYISLFILYTFLYWKAEIFLALWYKKVR